MIYKMLPRYIVYHHKYKVKCVYEMKVNLRTNTKYMN